MRGKAVPEDLNFLQEMTQESYSMTPKENINGWILRKSTPNTKFWVKGNQAIVGVRGTKSSEDVSAWPTVPLNTLSTTAVYKKNLDAVREFKSEFPGLEMYGVGHSLGGAIIDGLIRDGLLKEAVSYNPAIQYKDINGGLPNRRIYYGSDPLYKLMGWWDRKSEHRPATSSSWVDFLGNFSLPAAGLSSLASHKLSVFKGGLRGGGDITDTFLVQVSQLIREVLDRDVRIRLIDKHLTTDEPLIAEEGGIPRRGRFPRMILTIVQVALHNLRDVKDQQSNLLRERTTAQFRAEKTAIINDALDEVRAMLDTFRFEWHRDAPPAVPYRDPASLPLPEGFNLDEKCPVCQEKWRDLGTSGVQPHIGPCGHAVCDDDYARIVRNEQGRKVCPLCRYKGFGKNRKNVVFT